MNIYLDFDATLADFITPFLEYYNKKYLLNKSDIDVYNDSELFSLIEKDTDLPFWLNKEEYTKIKLFDGAIDFIKRLLSDGHNVEIISTHSCLIPDCKNCLNWYEKQDFIASLIEEAYENKEYSAHAYVTLCENAVNKYEYTPDGILVDDFALTIYNHVYVNKMPGVIFGKNSKYRYSNFTRLGNRAISDVVKIDSSNIYKSYTYDHLYELIKYIGER